MGRRKKKLSLKDKIKKHISLIIACVLFGVTVISVLTTAVIFTKINHKIVKDAKDNNTQALLMLSLETRRGEFITKWRPILEKRGCKAKDVGMITGTVFDELQAQRCLRTDKKEWVTPTLVFALIELESQYDPNAYNPNAHDSGLMQIIPSTCVLIERGLSSYNSNLFDIRTNIKFGIFWLRLLEQTSFSKNHMLGTYNAGRYWNSETGKRYTQVVLTKEREIKAQLKTYYSEEDYQLLKTISN